MKMKSPYLRMFTLAVMLLVLGVVAINADDDYNGMTRIVTNSDYRRLAEYLHALPHISFWEYTSDVVVSPESKYVESICLMAVPFLIFAILLLSCGCCFSSLRCCGLLGGWRQTRDYRTWERILLRVLLVLFLLVVIVLSVGSLWATVYMHQGVPHVADELDSFSAGIYINLRKVVSVAVPLEVEVGIPFPPSLFAMYNDSKTTNEDISDATSSLKHLELARDILTIIIIAFVIISCLVGLFGAVLGWKMPSLYMAIFLWLALVCTWVSCAVHLSAAVAVADGCQTVDQYLLEDRFDNTEHYNQTAVMTYYLFCNITMPPDIAQLAGSAVLLNDFAQAQYQSAEKKNDTAGIKKWGPIYNQTQVLVQYTMTSIVCNGTAKDYNSTKEELCTDVILGAFMVMITQFLVAPIGTIAVILGVLAYKRFGVPVDYILQTDTYDYDAAASARERRRLRSHNDLSVNRILQQ
eukprot:TRINITY_DN1303_c0_g1_i1.p1 TRINITY_DN1303_c0_g1~~TRINITY_DN1303_c0_g1_i1.p1  ORF type:complete len:466 (-),score=56.66 TRINITY_DN1303_c0_g1_i1:155-1552(-)